MKVRVFHTIEELRELESAWNCLLAETPNASFFQSFGWLTSYWKHYGQRQQLRVCEVSDGGETIGILPLVIKPEATRLGTIDFLTYPLDYWGSFYGPISREPTTTLSLGLSALGEIKGDWDVLELRGVGASGDERESTCAGLAEIGLSPILGCLDRTAIVSLDDTWDSYLASRGSKWRNNLKRWRRRLGEAGRVRYERYRSPGHDSDPRWDLFEACTQVAQRSWQATSTDGTTISHREISQFMRDAHTAAAAAGCIDINLMYVDDQPIAFAYNYQYRGHVFGLRVGYDPKFRPLGVGNLLYAEALQDSFMRGDWRYDMGPGSLEAKRHLHTDVLPIYRISHFPGGSVRQHVLRWKRERDAKSIAEKWNSESEVAV